MRTKAGRLVVVFGLCVLAAWASTSTPAAQSSISIWNSSVTPQGPDADTSAIELGVRFRSDVSGFITGVRFYKYSSNGGTHFGRLWANNGTLLANVQFTGETASGWQQVSFAQPVPIAANTTYVASYHTDFGHYAADNGYFAAGVDSPPLHALQDGGVYRYGAVTGFPNQSYQSTNYWVDVVFATTVPGGDTSLPWVTAVTPQYGNVITTSAVTASFSESMDAATVNTTTFQLRDPLNNVVPATVVLAGEPPTATLTPTSPMASMTTYSATVKGGAAGVKDLAGNTLAGGNYNWSFTTGAAIPPLICPCTIWNATGLTPGSADPDSDAVELGLRFRSDLDGYISGVRFYKGDNSTGTFIGSVWTNNGTRLGSGTVSTQSSAASWMFIELKPPVPISANTTYVASYHTDTGHYVATSGYFASGGVDNAPLHALRDGADGPSGVYHYGAASAFPTDTYNSSNYWVEPAFKITVPPADTIAPTVAWVAPAPGATGVSARTVLTAGFSEGMSYPSINTDTFQLHDAAGNLVPAEVSPGGETGIAALTTALPLALESTYTGTLKGGSGGIKDMAGNPLAADYSWSFTTGGTPPPPNNCPCMIWSNASTTAIGPDSDASPVELGLRFRSDVDGFITAIRFYKHSINTGTHVGNLWTNTGTRLATATFTNESASGWQQVTFATPVPIAANTTYVASYHTNAGHYAASPGYLLLNQYNAPLQALEDGADGPNGVYHYGSTSSFPNDTYLGTNYWVDVVFVTTVGP